MPLKVNGGSNRKPQNIKTGIEQKRGLRIEKKDQSQFNAQLNKHLSDNKHEFLKEKALEIEKQGKKLAGHIDISELIIYKRMIAEFLNEAVRSYELFSKQSYLDRRGRHRIFAVVKIINKKLEKLTQDVLSSEKNNINIIGSIEDIRGLVFDLIL